MLSSVRSLFVEAHHVLPGLRSVFVNIRLILFNLRSVFVNIRLISFSQRSVLVENLEGIRQTYKNPFHESECPWTHSRAALGTADWGCLPKMHLSARLPVSERTDFRQRQLTASNGRVKSTFISLIEN